MNGVSMRFGFNVESIWRVRFRSYINFGPKFRATVELLKLPTIAVDNFVNNKIKSRPSPSKYMNIIGLRKFKSKK
jgi:hypothetical protein